MTYVFFPLAIIAAYLLGSIPFGLIIVKAHGKDLRLIGSGNIGATNVSRALGRKWAYFCFVLDVLVVARRRLRRNPGTYLPDIHQIQRRQGSRNEFWRGAGPLAVLYDLCLVCRCSVGGCRFDLAICFPGINRRFGYLPPRFDCSDYSNTGLGAWRFVADTKALKALRFSIHFYLTRQIPGRTMDYIRD